MLTVVNQMESRAFRAEQKAGELADAPVIAERKWSDRVSQLMLELESVRADLMTMRSSYIDLKKRLIMSDRRGEDAQLRYHRLDVISSVNQFKVVSMTISSILSHIGFSRIVWRWG